MNYISGEKALLYQVLYTKKFNKCSVNCFSDMESKYYILLAHEFSLWQEK